MEDLKLAFRKIKNIKGLLEHPGWEEFKTKLNDRFEYHQEQINLICSKSVRPHELDNLNDHLNARNTIAQILSVELELLEEIDNSSDDADVKQESEVFVENR